ncbi:MAG: hypothetical protein ACOVQ5_06075, partial [Flavobacteriales bacterium]
GARKEQGGKEQGTRERWEQGILGTREYGTLRTREHGILGTWEQGNIPNCELVIPNFQTPISNL